MPKFPRLVVPGYPHHITQRGVRRQKTFFAEDDYQAYLDLAIELTGDWPVEFWAYCLLPNHIHAVVVPDQPDSLSKYFAVLHRRYARQINLQHEWQGHLWQKRFYSVVMDERHTIASLRYVELNPVRAGIRKSPRDWPWSSTKGNLGLTDDPLIDRSRTVDIIANWSTYLAEEEDVSTVQRLRRQTRTGRPNGDDEFLRTIESRTERRVRKKRAGRKKK
jgi:putative transposase